MVAARCLTKSTTVLGFACLLLTGCSSARITLMERSSVEQELLVRSLERAVAQLDLARLLGKRVSIELHALTKDETFARKFVTPRLQQRGVQVASDDKSGDLLLKVFASVLAVDSGDALLGIPALPLPGLSFQTPEIALAKWVRNRGHSEVQVYAFDGRTGRFIEELPLGVGRAKFDRFTLLIGITFTVSDLDKRPTTAPGQ